MYEMVRSLYDSRVLLSKNPLGKTQTGSDRVDFKKTRLGFPFQIANHLYQYFQTRQLSQSRMR